MLGEEPPTVEQSRQNDETVVSKEEIDCEAGAQLDYFKEHVMGANYEPRQAKAGAGVCVCECAHVHVHFFLGMD